MEVTLLRNGFFGPIGAVVSAGVVFLSGCADVYDRNPVPPTQVNGVQILDVPNARMWADERDKLFDAGLAMSAEELRRRSPAVVGQPHNYLAISGGGDKGAFGAGLLCGWSETGARPVFDIVTGISTGGLTAPFAFLGSKYDYVLREVYTTTATADLVTKRPLTIILSGDSVADTTGLKNLIDKHVTADFVAEIAAEHRTGRRLWVGTTNLDAGRPVMWNIGAIANSQDPRAVELIRQILRASAAIPVAFPPEFIEVTLNGMTFDEMHVDGGATTQVVLYPETVEWMSILEKLEVPGKPRAYVIFNAFVDPPHKSVEPNLFDIAGKTVSSLIRTQGLGDLDRIYAATRRDGVEFYLAYPPADLPYHGGEPFDPEYMQVLFDRGYAMALAGYPWERTPPHLVVAAQLDGQEGLAFRQAESVGF